MSRQTAYRTRMAEQHYTEQELVCDVCGTVTPVVPLGRPEGWLACQWNRNGETIAQDFCSFACFYGWAQAENDPIDLKPWEESIEMLAERQFAAEWNRQEQEREE